jgi:hypothetical protein
VRKRNNRKKGKSTENTSDTPAQINLTPKSYAGAAAAATETRQSTSSQRPANPTPQITEVTVLRHGGHLDLQLERQIRARAADAIVREVRLNMAKAVTTPIPLRAGRWSVHPRSRGNFVFSFSGHVPFDIIESYEHILLAPFLGSGQLCPSLGWTRLLVHGVPIADNNDIVFGPDELLTEVRTLLGLKKAFFAMPPRWLKPIEQLPARYSTITFAISDPDGSHINTLIKGHPALFGKEVKIQKWIDKPALVQCSRCHALGHTKASKACPLAYDSVKCYICGAAHKSEEHDQRCPRKHAFAGKCDCSHFKCLNCAKTGHHCRDETCPARNQYRPRNPKRSEKTKGKGKARDRVEGPGLPWSQEPMEEHTHIGNEEPTELAHQEATPAMEVDKDSPSRPQWDAAADPFQ